MMFEILNHLMRLNKSDEGGVELDDRIMTKCFNLQYIIHVHPAVKSPSSQISSFMSNFNMQKQVIELYTKTIKF